MRKLELEASHFGSPKLAFSKFPLFFFLLREEKRGERGGGEIKGEGREWKGGREEERKKISF